ncbi:DUF2931 family protein [Pectobacterium brasiliense]|nr:DUF2931 family protein [Pectobacterium brasiliense]WJM83580.1 DUF2931 family protein [Pectobacterium brasiliense]
MGGYPGGGVGPGASVKRITEKRYYWAGGGGLPVEGMAVPDHAVVEMVSLYDRKRYRITVDLPLSAREYKSPPDRPDPRSAVH